MHHIDKIIKLIQYDNSRTTVVADFVGKEVSDVKVVGKAQALKAFPVLQSATTLVFSAKSIMPLHAGAKQ